MTTRRQPSLHTCRATPTKLSNHAADPDRLHDSVLITPALPRVLPPGEEPVLSLPKDGPQGRKGSLRPHGVAGFMVAIALRRTLTTPGARGGFWLLNFNADRYRNMKRRDLPQHSATHGCSLLREGGSHSWWHSPALNRSSAVPRRNEISDHLTRKICKDRGVPIS